MPYANYIKNLGIQSQWFNFQACRRYSTSDIYSDLVDTNWYSVLRYHSLNAEFLTLENFLWRGQVEIVSHSLPSFCVYCILGQCSVSRSTSTRGGLPTCLLIQVQTNIFNSRSWLRKTQPIRSNILWRWKLVLSMLYVQNITHVFRSLTENNVLDSLSSPTFQVVQALEVWRSSSKGCFFILKSAMSNFNWPLPLDLNWTHL